mgnify:CR=1 FL=1
MRYKVVDFEISESIPIHASLLDRIWMPDLIFTNEKSSRFHNVTTENKLVRLSKNGDVYTSTRISLVMQRLVTFGIIAGGVWPNWSHFLLYLKKVSRYFLCEKKVKLYKIFHSRKISISS